MIRVILIVMAMVVAGFAGYMYSEYNGPACPTEDSCSVEYERGRWHISEDR